MRDWLDWIVGSLFLLILGGYKYTYNISLRVATKSDLAELKEKVCKDSEEIRQRVDLLIEHLLDRSIAAEFRKKNGQS